MTNLLKDQITNFGGYQTIINDEVLMKTALYKIGPLIVSFNVDCINSSNYRPGKIVNGTYPGLLNHNALAVGYGHDNVTNLDYYIVKNSWGNTWDIRILKNSAIICYYFSFK